MQPFRIASAAASALAFAACSASSAGPNANAGAGLTPTAQRSRAAAAVDATLQTDSGTITDAVTAQFTIDTGAGSLIVHTTPQTKITGPAPFVGETVAVTGSEGPPRQLTAATVTQESVTSPTPSPVVLSSGAIIGADGQFSPPDGDLAGGGAGQAIDGIPCAPTMALSHYHVHWYVGLLVNGKQIAIPDQIGMVRPGPIVNGFTATAHCYYEIHTHDASGMIHVESPSLASFAGTIFSAGTFFDIWGLTVRTNRVGPFKGIVRVFVDRTPFKALVANSYTEYIGDPATIPIYSHEAVWLEVGPTYVVPPNLPAVKFYTEY